MNPMQADLYPSRQEDQPSWQERLDPVVYRSDLENAPIAAELIERFERERGLTPTGTVTDRLITELEGLSAAPSP